MNNILGVHINERSNEVTAIIKNMKTKQYTHTFNFIEKDKESIFFSITKIANMFDAKIAIPMHELYLIKWFKKQNLINLIIKSNTANNFNTFIRESLGIEINKTIHEFYMDKANIDFNLLMLSKELVNDLRYNYESSYTKAYVLCEIAYKKHATVENKIDDSNHDIKKLSDAIIEFAVEMKNKL